MTDARRKETPMRAFLLALVLVVGVAATAWAAIPDGTGAISGCYAKKGGKLRVVKAGKTCKKTERPLTWNQTGPAGAPGSRGPAGPKGEKGAKGEPGRLGPTHSADGFDILENETSHDLLELSLPAGSYLLFGTGVASNDADETGQVSCLIGSALTFVGEIDQTVPAHEVATFTAQRAVTVETDDTLTAMCIDPVADEAISLGLTFTAIPVGDIVP
jgi:hypothetical protein